MAVIERDWLMGRVSGCAQTYAPYCLGVPYIAFDENGDPYIHSPVTDYSSTLGSKYFEEFSNRDEVELGDVLWAVKALLSKIRTESYLELLNR